MRRLALAAVLAAVVACAPRASPAAATPAPPVGPCRDLPSCEAACLRDGASCAAAAADMRATPTETTALRYATVLDRACASGSARSCNRLADLVVTSPELEPDAPRSRRAYDRACALADGASCLSRIGDDAGADADASALRAQLDARCAHGDGQSCAIAGVEAILFGRDFDAKAAYERKAVPLLEADCRSGEVDDCSMVAGVLGDLGVADRDPRVTAVLARGCELGDGSSCLKLAATATADRGASLRARACRLGATSACVQLATAALAANAPDGPRLLARAIAVGKAACALADEEACEQLAELVGSSAIAAADVRDLAGLAERACDRGQILTCVKLADAVTDGPLHDEARAQAPRARACKLGYPFARWCAIGAGQSP